MPKAKTIDRLELTRKKMEAARQFKANAQVAIPPEYTKENSPFIKMRDEYMREHSEEFKDENHICPLCGGELVRYEGCYRCKKCGWSKC